MPRRETTLLLCLVTSVEVLLRSPCGHPRPQTPDPVFSPLSSPGKSLDFPGRSQTSAWASPLCDWEEAVLGHQATPAGQVLPMSRRAQPLGCAAPQRGTYSDSRTCQPGPFTPNRQVPISTWKSRSSFSPPAQLQPPCLLPKPVFLNSARCPRANGPPPRFSFHHPHV